MVKKTDEAVADFFGKPVHGHIDRSYAPTEQADPQLFADALFELLEHPEVEAVRWYSYVPGFNDGEPCTYTLGDPSFKFTFVDEDYESDKGGPTGFVDSYDIRDSEYGYDENGKWTRKSTKYEFNGRDLSHLAPALEKFFDNFGEQHEAMLQQTFGSNADVIATKDGFDVEFYDCGF
jgi:hypothetical protein